MSDLSTLIGAKSDQLNNVDLMGGPRTIVVTKVRVGPKSEEQPCDIYFEGDDGKPYRPGLSMRRLLVELWGADTSKYAGRAMTLYRDPEVSFGKEKTGGTRISHVSNIDDTRTVSIPEKRGKFRSFTVKPLRVQQQRQAEPMPADVERLIADASTQDELIAIRADSEQKPFWPAVDQATRRRKAAIKQEQQQDENGSSGTGGDAESDDAGTQGGDDGYDGI